MRITAFVLRSIVIASDKVAANLGAVIADQVLFAVGYCGLLYSAYTLVLDR